MVLSESLLRVQLGMGGDSIQYRASHALLGKGLERDPALSVKAVNGFDQADGRELHQVAVLQVIGTKAVHDAASDDSGERQVTQDDAPASQPILAEAQSLPEASFVGQRASVGGACYCVYRLISRHGAAAWRG